MKIRKPKTPLDNSVVVFNYHRSKVVGNYKNTPVGNFNKVFERKFYKQQSDYRSKMFAVKMSKASRSKVEEVLLETYKETK